MHRLRNVVNERRGYLQPPNDFGVSYVANVETYQIGRESKHRCFAVRTDYRRAVEARDDSVLALFALALAELRPPANLPRLSVLSVTASSVYLMVRFSNTRLKNI